MRTIVLLLLSILLLPIGYSQNLDSTEIENRFQQILPLEQAAYYDSAAQAYRQLRTQLRQQKSLDASHRATYKIGYCLIRAGQRAEAIDSLTTGIGQMLQHEDSSYLYIVSAYNELGTASWLLGDISQAGQYYQKSLTLALKAKPPLAARIKVARFNIALIRMRQGYYQEAINSFQTMIADLQQNQPTRNDSLTIANAWINIASAYNSLGNYTRSLEYNRLGLEAHRNYYGDDHPQIGNDLTNIGHILEILKRHDEALPYHKQALQIQQARLGDDHPTLGNTYLNLGASYEGLKQYDSSLYYYDKAYQIYLATRESDDYDLRLALNNLGGIAYEQQDYLQAANYHRQSIQRTGPNAYEEIYGEALYALGADLWALGQIDSGRYYIEAGLAELRKSSPDGALINSVFKASILQGYTTYAGSIWHQEERHEEASLDEILSLVDSGQQVLYGARLSDIDAASRYAMRVNGFNLLSISLEASYARHQLSTSAEVVDQAFRFAEREKSASLYDQLKRTDALQFAGISPESQAKEEAVRNRLAHLREQLYYSLSSDEAEVLLQLRADIEATKREYDVLLKKLEQDYPQYFFLQQGEQDISLSAVQERLSPKDAMLVFTVLDSSIMLWVIQAGQVDFQRLAKPVDLSQQITNFRALAERPSTPLADYLSLASPLYEALLRPGLAKLPPDVQNLILIPDAELSLLPFEVLTASPNAYSYQDADYLFQQYAVSYAYSAAVYLEQTKPKAPSYESLFAGFAANYEVPQWSELDSAALLGELVRSGELPLPAARQEVIDIAGLMGGQAFLDDDASEQSFRDKAVDYAILHLAMHTLLDDRDPMFSKLVFSPSADTAADGLLTAAELYNLRLPSQLTVLSACNTGFGKIIEGEGVMSLSRAFAYAGCPSTLMSLWKVPDNATRQLMLAFYQGLKDGKSKNEALREAKIKYLQSVKTSEQAHPFYWAGFVQMGNPAPLQTKSWWQHLEAGLIAFGDYAWGYPLLIILMGGGLFFLFFSRLLPYRHLGHSIQILRGKYDDPDDPGEISHYQALSTALAATVGMGNISGVAVAIVTGGPGAIFWMWLSALVGVATKFFTCTLAIMYRGKDSEGNLQGGPMYVITEGMGRKWKPLAVFFSLAGLIGCLPLFQANQLTATIQDVLLAPAGIEASWQSNALIGLVISLLVAGVMFGGIKRIGAVAGRMVPFMVLLYLLAVIYILAVNASSILPSFALIMEDAFSGTAVLGGALGTLILTGVRRAAFSNEAGIGTAPMAHGAAKTKEPVREGLIAMLAPFIDTIVVCTLTALAIIISGVWQSGESSGITVTLKAFESAMPGVGSWLLTLCVLVFSLTTLFTYSYYGTKCLNYLAGAKYQKYYQYFYVISIVYGAVATLDAALALIDGMYALMTVPTVLSAIYLSPRVYRAAKEYFAKNWDV